MAELDLVHYTEVKPHYFKMVVWRIFNALVFPLLPRSLRTMSLRLFGAQIGRDCLFKRQAKFYAPWNFKCGDAVCVGPRAEIYNKDVVCLIKVIGKAGQKPEITRFQKADAVFTLEQLCIIHRGIHWITFEQEVTGGLHHILHGNARCCANCRDPTADFFDFRNFR